MWLRDFLPERFPQTRIMTYGYDSSFSEPTGYNLLDYARSFEQCIVNARDKCPVLSLWNCYGVSILPVEYLTSVIYLGEADHLHCT